jgi:hypothetical protein
MTVALFTRSLRWLVKRPASDGVRRETERHLRAVEPGRTDAGKAARKDPRP